MTFHRTTSKIARGSWPKGVKTSPRTMVSFNADDLRCAQWWAKKEGIPVSTVIRNALYAYVQCIRADVPADYKPRRR